MKRLILFLSVFFVLILSVEANAAVYNIYVDSNVVVPGDGSSDENAYEFLTDIVWVTVGSRVGLGDNVIINLKDGSTWASALEITEAQYGS